MTHRSDSGSALNRFSLASKCRSSFRAPNSSGMDASALKLTFRLSSANNRAMWRGTSTSSCGKHLRARLHAEQTAVLTLCDKSRMVNDVRSPIALGNDEILLLDTSSDWQWPIELIHSGKSRSWLCVADKHCVGATHDCRSAQRDAAEVTHQKVFKADDFPAAHCVLCRQSRWCGQRFGEAVRCNVSKLSHDEKESSRPKLTHIRMQFHHTTP